MARHDEIISFIRNFRGSESVFLNGCCYWFAKILSDEFNCAVVYEPTSGHFLAEAFLTETPPDACHGAQFALKRHLFDVRGDVTEQFKSTPTFNMEWIRQFEPDWHARLIQNCRHFKDSNSGHSNMLVI